jgi:hypothetical protein
MGRLLKVSGLALIALTDPMVDRSRRERQPGRWPGLARLSTVAPRGRCGQVPCRCEDTTDYGGVAMQGAAESLAGLGRAIPRLPALARFAPRFLVLNLADQVSTHLREGMIKVAFVGGGHEVSPSR